MEKARLLKVDNLKKYYPITAGLLHRRIGDVKAVDGVSLFVLEKETLGLVGESGCGKSTLGRVIVKLENPTSGEIWYKEKNITHLRKQELKYIRKEIQIIFQDPQSSLDPRMTVGDSIEEALLLRGVEVKQMAESETAELLNLVGLEAQFAVRYPHEFSGGEKQRIGIARTIAMNPKLVIADEPVSALDVSVQAQILNLLIELKDRLGIAFLFIAHDLSVIRHISDRVLVMYLGKPMELAFTDDLFTHPAHPYTQALLSAIPTLNPHLKNQPILLPGDVPSPANPPSGCRFHTRCFRVMPVCSQEEPVFTEVSPLHSTACHLYN